MKNVKVSFNGESVASVIGEYFEFSPICDEHDNNYMQELSWLDSTYIVHECIEKRDPEFKNITQMSFEAKDGLFTLTNKDDDGSIVKIMIIPLQYRKSKTKVICSKCGKSFEAASILSISFPHAVLWACPVCYVIINISAQELTTRE